MVKGKQKYNDSINYYRSAKEQGADNEDEEARDALNIMYDKRVFRGNTYNQNLLKAYATMTPAQKEEQRIAIEREKRKVEMIK